MGWYTCRTCKHDFHSGFFNITYCPKCWGKFSQITEVVKGAFKILILPVIVLVIMRCASPVTYGKISGVATAALDSTTLYSYSKDAYLESIIHGRQEQRFYTISGETPYYSSILSKPKLEDAEPLGVLPENAVVELRNVVRKGGDVWIPAFFYIKDKPQQAFALFPRDWEENVSAYDMDAKVGEIKSNYEKVVRENFELMEVEPKDEKEYKEKYNDYYKVADIGEKTSFYAPKTDKSRIDAIYAYYLSTNSINMVVLQTDKEWERPELGVIKTEEEE